MDYFLGIFPSETTPYLSDHLFSTDIEDVEYEELTETETDNNTNNYETD